ncbi:MAG: hypothetical protein ACI9WU_001750 [Myxococcota bacterium]
MTSRVLIIAVHLVVLIGAGLGTVYARQSLKFASVPMTTAVTDDTVYLPSKAVMRGSSLGYGPFFSDMVFIRTHAYFLRHMYTDRNLRWLDGYVEAIVALDPDNRDIYSWAATVVRYGQVIDEDTIARSNHFAELGLERFPDDPTLYAHLGFNKYFELRPKLMDKEEALQAQIAAGAGPAEQQSLLQRLAEVRARRYRLEREAVLDYTMSSMQPNSTVDPVFLATLYIKHDEAGAAGRAIASLYGTARPADQEQLLFRLRDMGQDKLASELESATKIHEEDMPYVPEGLYRLLARQEDLRVPDRWDSTTMVLEHALRAIDRSERGDPE